MIKSNDFRTREQKLSVVEDLTSLCKKDFKAMYRPGKEPVNGAYPVCSYRLPDKKPNRASHIHACRRREFAANARGVSQAVLLSLLQLVRRCRCLGSANRDDE